MNPEVSTAIVEIWKTLLERNFIYETHIDEDYLSELIEKEQTAIAYVIFNDFPERIKVSSSIDKFIVVIKKFIEMCGNAQEMSTIIWQRVMLYNMCDINELFEILFDAQDEVNVLILLSINTRLMIHKLVKDVLNEQFHVFLNNPLSKHLRITYGMLIIMSREIIDERLLEFVNDDVPIGKEELLAIYAKKNEL